MSDLSGHTVQGYELLERIGSGGFGAVYRARQATIEREVALKVILPFFTSDPEFIRRFEIEAQLVARLEHLHIVPLYDYWRDMNGAFLAMRWMRGGSLHDAIRQQPYDLAAAALVLDQVASGLAAAHGRGVIHRDLKPSNILLDEEGNAYLADFGIAKDLVGPAGKVAEHEAFGGWSPDYVSPEHIREQRITPQSDIYSLGITLYEMLTGRRPFAGRTTVERLFKQVNEPLPDVEGLESPVAEAVNEVVQRATAKDPRRRYEDPLEMSAAFRQAARLDGPGTGLGLSDDVVETLTRREQEILHLIAAGESNKQIAESLFVELSTVKWHITQLYRKLQVRSRVQAIVRARELDLIVPTPVAEEEEESGSISVPLPVAENPYKGLRAFGAADHLDFFGRERMVEKLVSRLSTADGRPPLATGAGNPPGHGSGNTLGKGRLLAVVGPSGSGKSSLVGAGLIPALWAGKVPGSEQWYVVEMVPGTRPLDELEIALTRIAADQSGNLRGHLDRDENGLLRAASLTLPKNGAELVLVIDQFEELFTLVSDEAERAHFLELLRAAVCDPRSRVRVILALRADFYDRPLHYPAFGELVRRNLETVLPLSAEELERAILRPAERVGVGFEPGLVASIIEEVNYRPGSLPLLQYALTELFEQRQGRLLTHEAYEAIGGSVGALAGRAEELYQEQGPASREAIRQLFLRLVTIGEMGDFRLREGGEFRLVAPATRRRVLRSELLGAATDEEADADQSEVDELIDTFAAYRLLSLDRHPGTRQPTVEIAHEALLLEWERLASWLAESRQDLLTHRQLARAANEWQKARREASFLLRGSRLDQLAGWADQTSLALTKEERSFLEAGLAARQERQAAEQERQAREIRLELQSNRRLRWLLAIMAAALVIAVGLSIAALTFARQATEQQRLAAIRELAAASLLKLDTDPELSILLALEAAGQTYAQDGTVLPEVEDALHRTIQASRVLFSVNRGRTAALSPDGAVLAASGPLSVMTTLLDVATGDRTAVTTLLDAATGEVLRQLHEHSSGLSTAFSPDGRLLAIGREDTTVKLFEVESGRELVTLLGHDDSVITLDFSPDGQRLVTGGLDGQLRFWRLPAVLEMATGPELTNTASDPENVIHGPGITSATFTPDGRHVVASAPGDGVYLWEIASGDLVRFFDGASDYFASLGVSGDGRYLGASTGDLAGTIWELDSGRVVQRLSGHSGPVVDVAFSPDGRLVATGGEDGRAIVWDLASGQQLLSLSGHGGRVGTVIFSPDGDRLFTSSDDRTTKAWDISPAGSRELYTLDEHGGPLFDAEYSSDGRLLVSAGADGRVMVWKADSANLLLTRPGPTSQSYRLAFDPAGERVASAAVGGGIVIWDPISGQDLMRLPFDAPASAVEFSRDGALLAAGGWDGSIHLWKAATGEEVPIQGGHDDVVMYVTFVPGSDQLTSGGRDEYWKVWDAVTGQQIRQPAFEKDSIWDLTFSPDGKRGATAFGYGWATIWNSETGTDLFTLRGHSGNVTDVGFNQDGSRLATASFDATAKIWDVATGKEILTLTGHELALSSVDFSADGKRLATASADRTVRVYVLDIEELIELARSRVTRSLTQEECQRYLHLERCPK